MTYTFKTPIGDMTYGKSPDYMNNQITREERRHIGDLYPYLPTEFFIYNRSILYLAIHFKKYRNVKEALNDFNKIKMQWLENYYASGSLSRTDKYDIYTPTINNYMKNIYKKAGVIMDGIHLSGDWPELHHSYYQRIPGFWKRVCDLIQEDLNDKFDTATIKNFKLV